MAHLIFYAWQWVWHRVNSQFSDTIELSLAETPAMNMEMASYWGSTPPAPTHCCLIN